MGTKYDSDDVGFKQESKDSVRGLKIGENGRISFYFIDEIGPHNRQEIVGKSFINTYFLYLNENLENDIDTIVVNSEVVSIDEGCTSIDFGSTTIIYNDSIYHDGEYLKRIDFVKKI